MIPIFRPSYGKKEIEAVSKVLRSGWAGMGPKTEEFEKKFASYIGTKYAVAVNSCTAALHLSLYVLGIEGKEVITTPLTFVSTNHAILYNRGIPVFTDVDPETLNIDPGQIAANITPKTKAIIAVHYGGNPCLLKEILTLAKKHKLHFVEDVAHACGAVYQGRRVGSFGDLACFSFHAVKNLATGDGGMITTNNKRFYERLRKLRWCGISHSTWQRGKSKNYKWLYNVDEVGFKCHMNDITAALGIVQLERLDALNKRRADIARRYTNALGGLPWLKTIPINVGAESAHHNYVIKTRFRDELNEYLLHKGIATGVHYYPNNLYPLYRRYRGSTPHAVHVWNELLTLPLYPGLKNAQVDLIINEIRVFGKKVLKAH